jgi:AraC-like DNA-binding protein
MRYLLESLENVIVPLIKAEGYSVVLPPAQAGPEVQAHFIEAYSHDRERHPYFEWTWLLSGQGRIKIGGEVYELKPGDMCILPPLVPHADVYDRTTPPYESLWFAYTRNGLHGFHYRYQPFGRCQAQSVGACMAPPEVGRLLQALQSELNSNTLYNREVAHGLLLQLVALLRRSLNAALQPEERSIHGATSDRVIEFLRLNYGRDLSLAEIAAHTFLTPNYLTALFKQETGETIFDTLAQIRVERATELLQEDMPVHLVAKAVGFNSLDRFSRVFRRLKGMPPSRYGQPPQS